MNKMDDAWAVMKKLPARERERVADAILDFAASVAAPPLAGEQVTLIKRRMGTSSAKTASSRLN